MTEQRRRFLLGEPQPDFWTDGPPPPAPPDHTLYDYEAPTPPLEPAVHTLMMLL